jgi:hypothetical protein
MRLWPRPGWKLAGSLRGAGQGRRQWVGQGACGEQAILKALARSPATPTNLIDALRSVPGGDERPRLGRVIA